MNRRKQKRKKRLTLNGGEPKPVDYEKRLDIKGQRLEHVGGQQIHWWVTGRLPSGQGILLGGYISEEEANKMGFAKLDGDFEVIPLKTIDRHAAAQAIKHRRLAVEDLSLEDSMQRIRHRGRGTPIE